MTCTEEYKEHMLYSNILLKLYLKSLKYGGTLQLDENIPYTAQMIATITRQQVGTVERALQIFMKLGLVEPLDNGALYMSNIELFIGQSSTEGERKRRARMKISEQKRLSGQVSEAKADICPPEIEIKKEIDIEIEKERELKPGRATPAAYGRSIIKRKKNYSVVYNYVDENGETKQKWETWHTHKEALKRKAEIENQQHTGTFLPPSNQTITEFLYDFVSLYGEKKWGVSMYDGQTALIANYINPIIGDMEVQAVTPRAVDGYIQTLQKTKSVSTKTRKAVTTYVSDKTIEKIIKLLRCAFKQAVRWEIIARNPFDNVILPKTEYAKRDIWTADMIRLALDKCTDSKLYVAMNLSFACSLRMGEILGLTWENVHISDEDIAADNAYVYIDKELTRASKRAIETLGEKDIYYIFTPLMPNTSTRIILKKPKTDSSIRKVWLPKTLAYILREWKKSQDELKGFLGDEYQDFDLVVALPNGRPCEDRIILKEFAKLREDAGLPKVVFHSLRHSSTTYKLKLNHGDLKATQGDTGHAEIDMITSIYAHILDEDRKVNAQKFETAFYAKPDLRNVRPPEEPVKSEPATLDLESLVEQLQKSPELASALAALIAAQAPAK